MLALLPSPGTAQIEAAKPQEKLGWHATGTGGAVAAQAPEAVRAGISILEKGGNAADAAVAVLMAASIADYGMFCMGAEVPFMIYDAKKREVKVLSGLGGAPLDEKAIAWFYDHGIPDGGGIKAAAVPGAMSLFFSALHRYGTMDFATVVRPTLRLLDAGGEHWHDPLAVTLRKLISTEAETAGTRHQKLQAARDRIGLAWRTKPPSRCPGCPSGRRLQAESCQVHVALANRFATAPKL